MSMLIPLHRRKTIKNYFKHLKGEKWRKNDKFHNPKALVLMFYPLYFIAKSSSSPFIKFPLVSEIKRIWKAFSSCLLFCGRVSRRFSAKTFRVQFKALFLRVISSAFHSTATRKKVTNMAHDWVFCNKN